MTPRHYHMQKTVHDVDRLVLALKHDVSTALGAVRLARLELCLTEALTNLVQHAEPATPGARIDVTLRQMDDAVCVDIFDPDGAATFDPRAHATDLAAVDPMAERGRGLGVIMHCADAITYQPKAGRSCLTLTFQTATPAGDPK